MIRILSEAEIWNLVDSQVYGHLGCHQNGRTYVVPISFAHDGDRILGLTTDGLKVQMMRAHPDVCFQIERVETLGHWQSAILWGRFEELSGPERIAATAKVIDKYGDVFETAPAANRRGRNVTPTRLDGRAEPIIAYAIKVTEISGRSEGES